jgi:hypothetical protein
VSLGSRLGGLGLSVIVALGVLPGPDRLGWLGPARKIAPGVDFYQTTDSALVEAAGPIAVALLRLDPNRVRVASVLARAGEVDAVDTLDDIAAAHQALAAVNGGFFNAGNHEPLGVLKVAGELVSDATTPEGVVAIRSPVRGSTTALFDQASVTASLTLGLGAAARTVAIDGVDTTRVRGRLMLYTPMYHADTDTAPTGIEWPLAGTPLRVLAIRIRAGRTPIPPGGAVLSFGGTTLPADLAALAVGTSVVIHTTWVTRFGLAPARLAEAESVVGGAGLLRVQGRVPPDWPGTERLGGELFVNARHPRTMVGTDRQGAIWLATVDGRDGTHSVGMTFADLERLCDRLGLTNALNLDGGSSTAMVVGGQVVNKPAGGPPTVNNALVVLRR